MPTQQKTSHGDYFLYKAEDTLHPILLATSQGNLSALVAGLNAPIEVVLTGGAKYKIQQLSQLRFEGEHPLYHKKMALNLVTLAAYRNHTQMVDYLFAHREKLGLTPEDFIETVDTANNRRASLELKTVVEKYPDIIKAYNDKMAPHYKSYKTAEALLNLTLQGSKK